MELIIDRSKWLRGEGAKLSRLIRPSDGKMCCLGFYGLACGIDREELIGETSPDLNKRSVWLSKGEATSWLFEKSSAPLSVQQMLLHFRDRSSDCADLMSNNDSVTYSEARREEAITKLFAKHGVIVKFIDGI